MDWSVFVFDFSSGVGFTAAKIISNAIIFAVTAFIIFVFFKSKAFFIEYSRFFGLFFKKFLPLGFALRLAADVIEFFLRKLPSVLTEIAILAIEFAVLYFMFYLAQKLLPSRREFKPRKLTVFCSFVPVFAVAVWYVIWYLHGNAVKDNITEKFVDPSGFSYDLSFGFDLQVLNLLFSITLWVALLICFGIFDHLINDRKPLKISTAVARVICLLFVCGLVYCFKLVAFSEGLILSESEGSESETFVYGLPPLNCDYLQTTYARADRGEMKYVYEDTTVKFKHLNNVILKFSREQNTKTGEFIEESSIAGTLLYRYDFDAAAYINGDGSYRAIKFKRINRLLRKDDNLIAFMEQLITDGYFEAFEYSYKYLSRFDSDFISQYTEDKEATIDFFCGNSQNSYLNEEYMTAFIEKLD